MKNGRAPLVMVFVLCALVGFGISGVEAQPITPVMNCATVDMQGLSLSDAEIGTVVIDSAAITGTAPEHCLVMGHILPEQYFEVKLPSTTWNGKFVQGGGGGWDGSVGNQDRTLGLGYATAAGSGGHLSPTTKAGYAPGLHGFVFPLKEPYYTTFYNSPGLPAGSPAPPNTYAEEMTIDFGYRSHGATALLAKKIITDYYDIAPSKSYYIGCSNGGREALVVAQKYPTLFNGIVAGAPVISFVGTNMRGIWDNQQGSQKQVPPFINLSQKGIVLNQAVYGKCDSVDGLVDGFIDDPLRCSFDALTDLPACPGDVDAENCFTLAQRQALKNIYDGPYNSYGTQLYPGQPLSAEYLTPGTCFPQPCTPPPYSSGFSSAIFDLYAENAGQWLLFYEPGGPAWTYMDFDWDVDPGRIRNNYIQDLDGLPKQLSDIVDPATFDAVNSPNMGGLEAFYNNGGKLIHYHGWADSLVSPAPSVNFYEAVVTQMEQPTVDSFYKLYMVPGMGHCGGGIGCSSDISNLMVDALINWVETGAAAEPKALTGTRAENTDSAYGWSARTRPLCPYPQVARYMGEGSIDAAASFTCVTIVPAQVNIKQTKVKVGKGSFVADMTIPEGYSFESKRDISAAVSEGALAKSVSLKKKGTVLSANFQMKNVIGIAAGDAVTFTVTAMFDQGGQTYALEGSDTVEVMAK